jgi:hypothetical protein
VLLSHFLESAEWSIHPKMTRLRLNFPLLPMIPVVVTYRHASLREPVRPPRHRGRTLPLGPSDSTGTTPSRQSRENENRTNQSISSQMMYPITTQDPQPTSMIPTSSSRRHRQHEPLPRSAAGPTLSPLPNTLIPPRQP